MDKICTPAALYKSQNLYAVNLGIHLCRPTDLIPLQYHPMDIPAARIILIEESSINPQIYKCPYRIARSSVQE